MILLYETFNLASTSAPCLEFLLAYFCGIEACWRTGVGRADSRDFLGWRIDFFGHHQDAPYFDIGRLSFVDVGGIRCAHHAADWMVAIAGFDCGDLSTQSMERRTLVSHTAQSPAPTA